MPVWETGALAIRRAPKGQGRAVVMSAGRARPAAADPFARQPVPDRIVEALPSPRGWFPSRDARWQSAWRLRLDFRQTLLPAVASTAARFLDLPRSWWRSQSAPAVGSRSDGAHSDQTARRPPTARFPPPQRPPTQYGRIISQRPGP